MINITKEMAADIVKIIAAATHTKYNWQQVTAYISALEQGIANAELNAEPPPPDEVLKGTPAKGKPVTVKNPSAIKKPAPKRKRK